MAKILAEYIVVIYFIFNLLILKQLSQFTISDYFAPVIWYYYFFHGCVSTENEL